MENIIYEETRGLSSVFHIKCNSCGQLNTVNTSEQHRTGKRGPLASDINSRVVLGSLHAGIGQTQLNNFLSVLNVPSINSVLFKRREREIGNATEMVAKGSCTASLDIEKLAYENSKTEKDDLTDIAVSYDMGWQKRGKGHNSLTGHGVVMGPVTGKVLSFATRCKTCRVCDAGKKMGKTARNHDCRKNHNGSSKSMEREVACQLWCSAPDAGVKYSTYIGDDDSTTLADINNKVPYKVEKFSDIIHAKRSLTTRLYNLKDRFKDPNCSILSSKVISYFSKCFSYAISQNVGDPQNLKTSLNCIVPHAFGNHSMCNPSWCGYKQSPCGYKHSDLPYGKDLHGEPLQKALTELMSEYTTDVVINKLSPGANSQRNESLNNTIASKNPKTHFYGGSESNDFRVACGVAQKNLGYNYVSTVLEALNIESGHFCNSHSHAMDSKAEEDRKRKSTKQFKYRRNQLHNQKSSQTILKEAKEGTTYATSVGLNLDPQIEQPAPRPLADLDHLLESITVTELKQYENLVSPSLTKPNQATLKFDPSKAYFFVVFDTETTCTGRKAEICQLSATDETGLNIFSNYILPSGNVSNGASRVNKLSVRTINGKRRLYKENQPVETVTLDQALQKFLTFLGSVKYPVNSEFVIILIGHNALRF